MTSRLRKVLLVDDEPDLQRSICRALGLAGYEMASAETGEAALERLDRESFEAIVLDLGLPGIDGLEVCRRLRAAGDRTPILVLTARDGVGDRVEGLDVGADDYLVKPFALVELKARLRALLRRSSDRADDSEILRFADVELDLGALVASRGDREMSLSLTEIRLLETFLRNPRRALSRAQLYEAVWGYDFGETSNSLGVYVGYLRRKLEQDGASRLIQTVRGYGYALREP